MKPATIGLIAISALLAAIIGYSIMRPQIMVAPGPVIPAHAEFAQDCFACHTVFRGASALRCTSCHAVKSIGITTSKGRPLAKRTAAFHQKLTEPDCMACHTDHAGAAFTRRPHPRFTHALLQSAVRSQCSSCHQKPAGAFHKNLGASQCSQCHSAVAWRPASFNHDRYFRLDGDHAAPCATCHIGGDTQKYSCYGCHEHKPAKIIAEHREEGITSDISNCVRCHRSSREIEDEGEGEGGERRERRDD
jgi:hypothetical protein